jgi:hypothetical protein
VGFVVSGEITELQGNINEQVMSGRQPLQYGDM